MPVQKILEFRQSGNMEAIVSMMVAMNCAALIKGLKAANIITVTKKEYRYIKKILLGTSISCYLLKLKDEKYILYLCRKKAITSYINTKEVREFLRGYGYYMDGVEDMLKKLSERILMYCDGKVTFPHEIGVFLEYPLPDVKGFLENEGRNFKYTGYWKVYHNEQKTKDLFRCFDKKREEAVIEILQGKSIREIAV